MRGYEALYVEVCGEDDEKQEGESDIGVVRLLTKI